MTKAVRIENADGSYHPIVVEVYDVNQGGGEDFLAETRELNNPADLTEVVVYSGRYLKVREK